MINIENVYKLNQFAGKISSAYALASDKKKTVSDTFFVVIKINHNLEVRKVRFLDGSVIEILSEQTGYAMYRIDGRGNKFLRLGTPICPSLDECQLEYEKYKARKFQEKNSYIPKKAVR